MNHEAKKLAEFDLAEALTSDDAFATFMADALDTAEAGNIAYALDVAARAKGTSQIARETRLWRQSYRPTLLRYLGASHLTVSIFSLFIANRVRQRNLFVFAIIHDRSSPV